MVRRIAVWSWTWLVASVLCSDPGRAAGNSSLGVKAGLSVARHHGDAGATDFRMGFGGGISASISITAGFSVQPELIYVMKGGVIPRIELTSSSGVMIGSQSMTYAVDYVEVPVLARISVPTDRKVAPFFVAGPSVAFKVSEELRGGPTELPDRRDALASTDVGLAIGAGLEVSRGARRWLIETRYTVGVINALANPAGYSLRNGALLITAGLAWCL